MDVTTFDLPVVLGQLDLPGDARDVAVDPVLQIAAVASGAGGLHLVDVSDPMLPALVRTINVAISQVQVVDGVVYAAAGSQLRKYDLRTGERIETIFPTADAIVGLATEGLKIYVLDASLNLRVVDISGVNMVNRGQIVLPEGHDKLFVGGGIAYVSDFAAVGPAEGGYATVNVSDPDNLMFLSGPDPLAGDLPGSDVAVNGSGIGLLVGRPERGHFVAVVDASDPTVTNGFLTQFPIPVGVEPAQDVKTASGIGFVANSSRGLHVVNYLSFDSAGAPPGAALSVPAGVDVDDLTAGIQAQEGSSIPVNITSTDDVQVRDIELLVDGQVVANDLSFPFDLFAPLPLIRDGVTTATIQVRAIDTGGNTAVSAPLVIELEPDTFAPSIVQIDPHDGGLISRNRRTVRIAFSESMDASTLTAKNIRLRGPGGVMVAPIDVQVRSFSRILQLTYDPLALGGHRILIDAAAVTDRAGNPLGAGQIVSQFGVVDASTVWLNPNGGFFDDPFNWDTDQVPGSLDDVLISVPGGVIIEHRQDTTQINTLVSTNAFTLSGGVLNVADTVQVHHDFVLTRGTLANATVLPGRAGQGPRVPTRQSPTLDGVTLLADFTVEEGNASFGATALFVRNGLTIESTLRLESTTRTTFIDGDQTIEGSGQIDLVAISRFSGGNIAPGTDNVTVTIGPDISVRGNGSLGTALGSARRVVNQGSIIFDTNTSNGGGSAIRGEVVNEHVIRVETGARLSVLSGDFTNLGTVSVDQSTLELRDEWDNNGVINAVDSTVNLGGQFVTEDLGIFNRTGGTVNIEGTLDNQGRTLLLSAVTGDWQLNSGTILGGNIDATGGASFTVRMGSPGTLDGVTLLTDVIVPQSANLQITNDLTLSNASVRLAGSRATITFLPTGTNQQSLNGPGEIVFLGLGNFTSRIAVAVDTLTIAPNITVRGGHGSIFSSGSTQTLINEGTIISNLSGAEPGVESNALLIRAAAFINNNEVRVENGARLEIRDFVNNDTISADNGTLFFENSWDNEDVVNATDSTVNLGGNFVFDDLGTLNRAGASTVNLTGTLDNTGQALTLNAVTGSWQMRDGGTILGGTVDAAGGVALSVADSEDGRLDGVTLLLDITVGRLGTLDVRNDLTLTNVAISLEEGAELNFEQTGSAQQLLGGIGEVVFLGFGSRDARLDAEVTTLTIGPDIAVRGGRAVIGSGSGTQTIVNQGTITANIAGGSNRVHVQPEMFRNEGELRAENGGSLILDNDWTNSGVINLDGTAGTAALTLDGDFVFADIGSINRTGMTNVNITGTLDNTGSTLTLNATTGDWRLAGIRGTILGGTVATAGGAKLIGAGGILDGVQLLGDVDLRGNQLLTVNNGLTLDTQLVIPESSAILFQGTQTLDGVGEVLLTGGATPSAQGRISFSGALVLTIGPDITIRGRGTFANSGNTQTVINQGTILADVSGRSIDIQVDDFTNQGVLRAQNSATLTVDNLTSPHAGTLAAGAGGTIDIDGAFSQDPGAVVNIDVGGSATSDFGRVDIAGAADFAGGTLNLNLVSGFEPAIGDSFRIIDYGSVASVFDTHNGLAVPNGLEFLVTYNPTGLILSTVTAGGGGVVPPSAPVPPPASAFASAPVSTGPALTNRGTEFWIAFPPNLALFRDAARISVIISSDTTTSGLIEIPGIGFSRSFNAFAGAVTTVVLPLDAEIGFTSDRVSGKGVHVTANAPVAVYGISRVPESTDAFLALPVDLLGTSHVVLGYQNLDLNPGVDETFPATQFAIVAPDDGTAVTITPSVTSAGHPAGVPFVVNLAMGQTYLLQHSGLEPGDLSGTTIVANHPVAVFGGHAAANIPSPATGFADFLAEQLPPASTFGRQFVTAPLATRSGGDTFRFLAAADGTTVSVDGVAVATLDRGAFHEQLINGAAHITADGPILVAQYANSANFDGAAGDPFMMLVPAVDQFLSRYTVASDIGGLPTNFINVVAADTDIGVITLDSVPIAAGAFNAIGTSGFSFAQIDASGAPVHVLEGPNTFGVFVYGFGEDESYGYPAGLAFPPADAAVIDSLTLAPAAADVLTGSAHTVAATVFDVAGNPVVGAEVIFDVTGANPLMGAAFTNADGEAIFGYSGRNIGTDSILASADGFNDVASVDWTAGPPTIVIDDPADGTVFEAFDSVLVSGTAGSPSPGVDIVAVLINGAPVDVLGSTGDFFARVEVMPGFNEYELTAIDSVGATATANLTLDGTQPALRRVDFDLFSTVVSASFEGVFGITSFNEADDGLFVDLAVGNAGQFDADTPLLVAIDRISDPTVRVRGEDGFTPDGLPFFEFTDVTLDGTLSAGEITGERTVRFFTPSRDRFSFELVFFAQLNQAPQITSVPVVDAVVGNEYSYDAKAADPDGDPVVFSLFGGPAAMTIDAATGEARWTPEAADRGTHIVLVEANDGRGGAAQQRLMLTVTDPPANRPPVFLSAPVVEANVNAPYRYQPAVRDSDGDSLGFDLRVGPAGLTVDGVTGLVQWTPAADQTGPRAVTIGADDGNGGVAVQTYRIFVGAEPGNHAPIIVSDPVLVGSEGTDYICDVDVLEPDGDVLVFSLTAAPAGMTIGPATGRIDWLAVDVVLGSHDVEVLVGDGRGSTSTQRYTLAVRANGDPVITSIPPAVASVDQSFGFFVTADDPDGDSLAFDLTASPSAMAIDAASGLVTWTPVAGQEGSNAVTVQVSDGRGGLATQSFDIDVRAAEPNQDPQITSAPLTDAVVGQVYEYLVIANDPNGDIVQFTLIDAPDGMTIDPFTGRITWVPSNDQAFDQTSVLANVDVQVSDGRGGLDSQTFGIVVNLTDNLPPVIDSPAPGQATVGVLFRYDATATDLDGDVLAFDLVVSPPGMTVDPGSGTVVWRPGLDDVSITDVILRVRDGQGGVDLQGISLVVQEPNSAPLITSNPTTTTVSALLPFEYRVEAQDPDGDALVYSLDAFSSGMTIDPVTGVFSWTPTNAQLGDNTVTIVVRDGIPGGAKNVMEARQTFALTVVAGTANIAPVINSTPRSSVRLGGTYLYVLKALDANADPLTVALTEAPDGMTIDADGIVFWTPASNQTALNDVTIEVSDGRGGTATQAFVINVVPGAVNRAPVITSNPPMAALAGQAYAYDSAAIDADGDPLIWDLVGAPMGMSIDSFLGHIRWLPAAAQIGSHEVLLQVTDPQGGVAQQMFDVMVRSVNQPPVILSDPLTGATVGRAYVYPVRAVDPENDRLGFALTEAPAGVVIDPDTGIVQFTAVAGQEGNQAVSIAVTDELGDVATQSYTLVVGVAAGNRPPAITSTPGLVATQDQLYEYQVTAIDPNVEIVTFSLLDAPAGMTIDLAGGLVQFTPAAAVLGVNSITIAVADGEGIGGTQSYNLPFCRPTTHP